MAVYTEPVTDLIRRRRSWRSYTGEPLSTALTGSINSFIASLDPPPFGSSIRIRLLEAAMPGRSRMPGTYGVIKGAKNVLAGVLTPSAMCFEDFGYSFESVILFCTQLRLGTCWMGGSLNRSHFGSLMGLEPSEILPVVSPVGKAADTRTLLDTIFAMGVGSKNRKPFRDLFFSHDLSTPMDEAGAGRYAEAFEMLRLAPSATNRQPWRVVARGETLHFFLARTPGYGRMFSGIDLQRIDMGIAMFHFESTARHRGMTGTWQDTDDARSITAPNGMEYRFSWVPS